MRAGTDMLMVVVRSVLYLQCLSRFVVIAQGLDYLPTESWLPAYLHQVARISKTPMRSGATDAELAAIINKVWTGRNDRYSELRSNDT
ncbi:MAG: hypothetical protein Ct9H300mP19_02590 [Dehalococcoidia bacterium]|nr:MAG: hypothetical protein Ct9H300mP19_02590 [Dehalococcoidia bacterium]